MKRLTRDKKKEFFGCSWYPYCGKPLGIRPEDDESLVVEGVVDLLPVSDTSDLSSLEAVQKEAILSGNIVGHLNLPEEMVVPLGMDHEVPCVRADCWPYGSFPFDHFNPMQSGVVRTLAAYDRDFKRMPNLLVTSPTASGKTVVLEMLMSQAMAQGKKAVYLAPMKAIVEEKWIDWTNPKPGSVFDGKKGVITTGDYVLTEERRQALEEADFIVATTEMLDSKTRSRQKWLESVGVVVVDEGHLVGVEQRGDKLETALMRMSFLVPQATICLVSATMSNVDDLKTWLSSLNGQETRVVVSDYRPCKLHREMVPYRSFRMRYYDAEALRMTVAIETLERIRREEPDAQVLIFTGNKSWGRAAAEEIRDKYGACEFHSADLGLEDRQKLSERFLGGQIQTLVATTTLAWGVNLPARHVIVAHLAFGLTPMTSIDVNQMVGRAGRPAFDTEGFAHVLVPEHEMAKWEDVLGGPQVVSSKLNPQLLFHVVGEIATGIIQNAVTLKKWHSRSLDYLQTDKGKEPLSVDQCAEILFQLYSWEMIEPATATMIETVSDVLSVWWRCTKLGRVAAHLYFQPADVYFWKCNFEELFAGGRLDKVNENSEPAADALIAEALGRTWTAASGYISQAEKSASISYIRTHPVSPREEPWVKHAAGYWNKIQGRDVPTVLNPCVRGLVVDIDRVTTALKKVDGIYGWGRSDWFGDLGLRFRYGVRTPLVPLVKIKGVGRVYAGKLFAAGFQTAEMVAAKGNRKQLKSVLGSKAEAIAEAAEEVI